MGDKTKMNKKTDTWFLHYYDAESIFWDSYPHKSSPVIMTSYVDPFEKSNSSKLFNIIAERLASTIQALDSATQTNQVLVKRLKVAEEALEDIKVHSVAPFTGERWMNYINESACEALTRIRGQHG